MSKPKNTPLTLGSATVGRVRRLEMKDVVGDVPEDVKVDIAVTCAREAEDLLHDPETPNSMIKDAVGATLARYAFLNRRNGYSGDARNQPPAWPNVSITPIWIRGDGSIPWEHPPPNGNEEELRLAGEELAREFQASVRKSACMAAQWTWEALGNFAEHQAPPVMDAVEIALRREAEKKGETAQEKRWATLAKEAAETTEAKDNPRDWIAREVQPHIGKLRGKLRVVSLKVWRPFYTEEPPEDEAVEAARTADNLLADYLDSELNASGLAKEIRGGIERRQSYARQGAMFRDEERGRAWMLWFRPEGNPPLGPFPFLTLLALAVWEGEVRPKLEEERRNRERYYPARTSPQLDMYRRALYAPGLTVEVDASGRRGDILDTDGRQVGKVLPGAQVAVVDARLLDRMRKRVALTRKTPFIRGFNTIVCTAYGLKAADPDNPNPDAHRTLWFDGALQGFADAARIRAQDARPVLEAGQMVQLPMGDGGELGGLWMWRRFGGGRHAGAGKLRVTAAPEVVTIGGHRERAVPVLPPDREPGLPRDRALQGPTLIAVDYTLQWLRANAMALLDGFAPWTERVWLDIMSRVDPAYKRRERDAILGALRDGDDTRPALLVFPEPGAVTLNAEAYGDVLEFLKEGGARSKKSRKKGLFGAAVKAGEVPAPKKKKPKG